MEALLRANRPHLRRLKTLGDEVSKITNSSHAHAVQEGLGDISNKIKATFEQILATCATEEEDNLYMEYETACTTINVVKGRLHALINPTVVTPPPPRETIPPFYPAEDRLPVLPLPTFSGDVAEWPSFSRHFRDSLDTHTTCISLPPQSEYRECASLAIYLKQQGAAANTGFANYAGVVEKGSVKYRPFAAVDLRAGSSYEALQEFAVTNHVPLQSVLNKYNEMAQANGLILITPPAQ